MSNIPVEVYWNSRKRLWSVRHYRTKKVIDHRKHMLIQNAQFVVSEKGRQRVLKSGHKNVHAFIRGYWLTNQDENFVSYCSIYWSKVGYNPRKDYGFKRDDGSYISESRFVHCSVFQDNKIVRASA